MRDRPPRTAGTCLRLPLLALLLAYLNYGAIDPATLSQNPAEILAISIASFSLFINLLAICLRCAPRLPYSVYFILSADFFCLICWLAVIGVLGYWDKNVLYWPPAGKEDPERWKKECRDVKGMVKVVTTDDGGAGSWIQLVWCKVEKEGRERLIGNGAAVTQFRVLIGLAVGAVVFTGGLVWYVALRGKHLGLFRGEEGKGRRWNGFVVIRGLLKMGKGDSESKERRVRRGQVGRGDVEAARVEEEEEGNVIEKKEITDEKEEKNQRDKEKRREREEEKKKEEKKKQKESEWVEKEKEAVETIQNSRETNESPGFMVSMYVRDGVSTA